VDKNKFVSLGGYTLLATGFPRTGTSMLMRILKFSGIKVIADEEGSRPSSKFNPYGSLEAKDIGSLIKKKPKYWTKNKAVKIVAPYAKWFPVDRKLKAIFMQRDLREIVTSLLAMRVVWDEDIAESISWARGYLEYHNIPTLFIKYKDAIKYPRTTVTQIKDFLGAEIDVDKAVEAIDADARTRYKKDSSLIGDKNSERIIRTDFEGYSDMEAKAYGSPD
jgi:hypothetical protein